MLCVRLFSHMCGCPLPHRGIILASLFAFGFTNSLAFAVQTFFFPFLFVTAVAFITLYGYTFHLSFCTFHFNHDFHSSLFAPNSFSYINYAPRDQGP